jgi:outer membrane immunogenic protein
MAMKHALLAGVGLIAFAIAVQPSAAADVPVKAPVANAPATAPLFNWTGFYVGATAGWGWGNSRICNESNGECSPEFDVDGFVAGGTVGYNWQMGSAWVAGLEADLSYSDIRGIDRDQVVFGCGAGCRTELEWFGTARVRLGPAFDRFLPYVTGGLAFGAIDATSVGLSGGSTRTGWTVGAGAEFAFAPNWSAKLEYLYVDLDSFIFFSSPGNILSTNEGRFHVVRAGLNYRFATGKAPVVTKY